LSFLEERKTLILNESLVKLLKEGLLGQRLTWREREAVRLGEDLYKRHAIVKCPRGHSLNYYENSLVNEWGHHVFVWCEDCKRAYYVRYVVEVS